MKSKRIIFSLLLILSCSFVHAEYIIVDEIVYSINDEYSTATVLNFRNTNGTITVPSSINYRGVQYEVVGLRKYDFNADAQSTYTTSSLIFGDGLVTDIATLSAMEREERELPFRYDYDRVRATITALNLPNTLLAIHEGAFDGMRSLKSIVIPSSVKYLPDDGWISDNNIFQSYLPNLQSVVILGLPSFKHGDKEISFSSKDEAGNYNYLDLVKQKFNLKYCRNLATFSMPEYDRRLPLLQAATKVNLDLENEAQKLNAALAQVSNGKSVEILVPAIKDEACTDEKTIQEAYNQAHQYLVNMYNQSKSYALLYDSLTNLLKNHPYYDGSQLQFQMPELDAQEPLTSSIPSLFSQTKAQLIEEYNELAESKMERNVLVNQTERYIRIYKSIHPEKVVEIDNFFREYRCESQWTQHVYYVHYVDHGYVNAVSCRLSQYRTYKYLFDSMDEFNESYDLAPTASAFSQEITTRQSCSGQLDALKKFAPAHTKEIKLSNMNKKPNEATSQVIQILGKLKEGYYYSKAVSFLIETLPSLKKEYDKNGQYFPSELQFFEAYSSDSYSKILKENKKK